MAGNPVLQACADAFWANLARGRPELVVDLRTTFFLDERLGWFEECELESPCETHRNIFLICGDIWENVDPNVPEHSHLNGRWMVRNFSPLMTALHDAFNLFDPAEAVLGSIREYSLGGALSTIRYLILRGMAPQIFDSSEPYVAVAQRYRPGHVLKFVNYIFKVAPVGTQWSRVVHQLSSIPIFGLMLLALSHRQLTEEQVVTQKNELHQTCLSLQALGVYIDPAVNLAFIRAQNVPGTTLHAWTTGLLIGSGASALLTWAKPLTWPEREVIIKASGLSTTDPLTEILSPSEVRMISALHKRGFLQSVKHQLQEIAHHSWRPTLHRHYPRQVRQAIQTLLFVYEHKRPTRHQAFRQLDTPLFRLLLAWVASHYFV